ncbi:MAG TPA: ATP-binding cassette domain-containing protein, partial [Gammaproteobacteria bacterium]|nr:ATP-binding cassette domain-containing protein [Gammaproteobacteria bacterium]
MALACKPSLLIADEPTTALDVTTQASILSLLKELQHNEGLAMLLITHDLAIAAQMADRIAVMQAGVIVEQNSTKKFFAAPQHSYSIKLLKSLPSMLQLQRTPASESAELLTVKDLRVYFPIKKGLFRKTVGYVKAVDGIDFSLHQGQTLAIVGESGSGKSTVAKAVLALLKEATGDVQYADQNLLTLNQQQWRKYRADIQIIFQDPYSSLNSKLRVIDSLEEGMRVQGKLSAAERIAKIDELLLQVGLKPEHKWRYPHEFSGGERQRICIARALTVDPKIIICDEPTSSLDVSVQAQVLSLLLKLQQERNLTYLFISHDLNVVRLLAHYVLVMKDGRIVERGITKQVLDNPQNEYTVKLLSAVPRL